MSPRLPLAVGVALALAGAGCGSSASPSSSTSSSTATHKPPAASTANPNAPEKSPPGDIPDTQVYVRYTPASAGYSLKVPEGWARAAHGGIVTFTANLNSVRVARVPAAAAPSVASARATDVPQLARSTKGFRLQSLSVVRRPAGNAVRIAYLADSSADPVTGRVVRDAVERYTFFHAGHALVLTLSAPQGSDNVDPWRLISSSVQWR